MNDAFVLSASFQSLCTCAAGIEGLSDRSLYEPLVATVASVGTTGIVGLFLM